MSEDGVEFAIHGYIHADYRLFGLEYQAAHFERAVDTFKHHGIPFTGFRAPYLRYNDQTSIALRKAGFLYDSSKVIKWDVINLNQYSPRSREAYCQLLDFYQAQDACDHLALPRLNNSMVEIPVSIPDDEAIVDRLEITDCKVMARLWIDILQRTYESGELFTLQLHPERILLCKDALVETLQLARKMAPRVWIASLGEIAQWWKERNNFSFEIAPEGDGRYKVSVHCSERATVLVKNCQVNRPTSSWVNGSQVVEAREFIVEGASRPIIGVAANSSPASIDFLKQEGFIVEQSEESYGYGTYLADLGDFHEIDEKPLLDKLEASSAPLLRFWRWPSLSKSAMAVTGDLDSITLIDFILRVFENWYANRSRFK
jgi:peptidoglycan/xylan/chitin deacetylase (PgdA/CDA1 family)